MRFLDLRWLLILFCLSACAGVVIAQGVNPLRPIPTARSADELRDARSINQVADPQQQIVLARQFLNKYPDSKLRGIAYRYMVTALIQVKEYEQAVENARRAIEEQQDNLSVMAEICRMGSESARVKDFVYVDQARDLCRRAIGLIGAGSLPYEYSDEVWKNRRDLFLGGLHKSLGIIAYYQEQWSDAAEEFLEASRMVPKEPYSFYLLAKCRYNEVADKDTGKGKKQAKGSVNIGSEKLEEILSNLARAFVLSEQAEYQWLHGSVESEMQFLSQNLKLAKPIESYIQSARDETDAVLKKSPNP